MVNAPADLAAVQRDLARGLKLIEKMTPRYEKRRDYFLGVAGEFATSPALRKLLEADDGPNPLSFAHIPCEALADKIELAGLKAENEAANRRLTELADAIDLEDEVDDWTLKTCYFGDYYVIVDPLDETEAGTATKARAAGSSPLTTVAVYAAGDPSAPLFAVKRWKVGEGEQARWEAIVYYDDVSALLATPDGTKEGNRAGDYAPLVGDDDDPDAWRVAHEGGLMLVVHYRIGSKPYGTPAHSKAFGAQDAITKISAVNLVSIDAQGFPSRWALADPLAEIDDDIDDDFGTDGATTPAADGDGMTTATSGSSRLRDLPGTIKLLRGIKSVGTFEAADGSKFLEQIEFYLRGMAVATGVPLFEFDMKGEQPSGESRRRASARLNRRADKAKRTLGRSHVRLGDVLLAVTGIDPAEAKVAAQWLPTESESDADGMELVAAKIDNGVPVRDALIEAGYPEESVEEWYPKGDDAVHVTPALAASLATTLRELGQAVTLGAIDEADVVAMLPRILKGGAPEAPVVPPAVVE